MKSYFSDNEKNNYIKNSLERNILKYGNFKYAYAVMDKKHTDNIVVIYNIENDFVDEYLSNKYQNIDPIIITALNRITSFTWDDDIKTNSYWPMDKVFF